MNKIIVQTFELNRKEAEIWKKNEREKLR